MKAPTYGAQAIHVAQKKMVHSPSQGVVLKALMFVLMETSPEASHRSPGSRS